VGEDKPVYFLARDESHKPIGALPAFFFECDLGSLLISVPQAGGYGGVVVDDIPRKEEVYQYLIQAF